MPVVIIEIKRQHEVGEKVLSLVAVIDINEEELVKLCKDFIKLLEDNKAKINYR